MDLRWLLFDADGVIQQTRDEWLDELTAIGGDRGEEFVLAVFAAEMACIAGADFGQALDELREEFGIHQPRTQVIPPDFWIEVDPAMLGAIRGLRARGYRCGLATNQQNLRGTYMRGELGFAAIFDQQFYSWELGVAKPDPRYFTAILEQIHAAPNEVLFLDDHADNVDGARSAGLRAELFPRHGGPTALQEILADHGVPI